MQRNYFVSFLKIHFMVEDLEKNLYIWNKLLSKQALTKLDFKIFEHWAFKKLKGCFVIIWLFIAALLLLVEVYSKPCLTSTMERYAKIVNG